MATTRPPRLIHLMSLAQHRLWKTSDGAIREMLGISTAQLALLFVLEKEPGASPREASERLGVNASAITGLISRMEDAGLVRREGGAEDGRVVRLFATEAGLAKAAAGKPIIARLNARLTAGFGEDEIATVARFLGAILERF